MNTFKQINYNFFLVILLSVSLMASTKTETIFKSEKYTVISRTTERYNPNQILPNIVHSTNLCVDKAGCYSISHDALLNILLQKELLDKVGNNFKQLNQKIEESNKNIENLVNNRLENIKSALISKIANLKIPKDVMNNEENYQKFLNKLIGDLNTTFQER